MPNIKPWCRAIFTVPKLFTMKLFFNHQKVRDYALSIYLETESSKLEEILDRRSEAVLLLLGIDTGLKLTDLLQVKYSDLKGEYLEAEVKRLSKRVPFHLSAITIKYLEQYKSWRRACEIDSALIFLNPATAKPYTRQWAYKRIKRANEAGDLGRKVKGAGVGTALRATAAKKVLEQTKDVDKAHQLLAIARKSTTKKLLSL